MSESKAWVTCDLADEPHWEKLGWCVKPVPVPTKKIDPILGCVIDEIPAARPGQGEKYHGKI